MQAWHIGDNLSSDIRGASGAGLAGAVWVNAAGRRVPPDFAWPPSHTVAHVSELQSILEDVLHQDRKVPVCR